jgi:hypothetical protein
LGSQLQRLESSHSPSPSQLYLPEGQAVHVPLLQYWLLLPQELAVLALQPPPPQTLELSHSLTPSQL